MHKAILAILGALAVGCNPDMGTCSETDISAWSVSGGASPLYCDSKLIGYQLELDGTKAPQSFVLRQVQPLSVSGPVFVAADIDMLGSESGAVRRVAKVARGSAVYAEEVAAGTTARASAIVATSSEPLTYELRVDVPLGTLYRGQIRNVMRSP